MMSGTGGWAALAVVCPCTGDPGRRHDYPQVQTATELCRIRQSRFTFCRHANRIGNRLRAALSALRTEQ